MTVLPGLSNMKVNTAIGFILAACALLAAMSSRKTKAMVRIQLTMAGALVIFSSLTLLQHISTVSFGIDEMLFSDPYSISRGKLPGRVSAATATGEWLLGIALLTLDLRSRRFIRFSECAAIGTLVTGVLALLAYIFRVESLYAIPFVSTLALHTAILFCIMGAAVLLARPDRGVASIITSDTVGGVVARRLIPILVVASAAVGWLRLQAQAAGYFDTHFGVALLTGAMILGGTAVILAVSNSLVRSDEARLHTHARLEESEATLRRQAAAQRQILDALPSEVALLDSSGVISAVNAGWLARFPAAAGDEGEQAFIGREYASVVAGACADPVDAAAIRAGLEEVLECRRPRFETEYRRADGARSRWFEVRIAALSDGAPGGAVAMQIDITDRRRLESQLAQSQKLEAVGRLAGGVAHDFNNVLTAIIGFNALAQMRLDKSHPVQEDLASIAHASGVATDVVKQLMAFGRKQVVAPRIMSIGDQISTIERLLQRLIGDRITISTRVADDLWPVRFDTGQLEQVLMNLATNSRDAMPDGGVLSIDARNLRLTREYAESHPEIEPGDYVCIAVSDTGQGMSRETLEHVFEPFFTTKGHDKGNGLGLPTCFGIVKQHGGHIHVYSELGNGTTVTLYIPRADVIDLARSPRSADEGEPVLAAPGETVLLVEDDNAVRAATRSLLQALGYTVLAARSADDAMLLAADPDARIDAVLTDVCLPGTNGKVFAERFTQQRPGTPIIFTSGHTAGAIECDGFLNDGARFIPKPSSPAILSRAIRDAIDAAARATKSP